MHTLNFTISLLLLLLLLHPTPSQSTTNPPQRQPTCPRINPVPVDLPSYQGTWYNILTDPSSYQRFLQPSNGGSCVTANYTLNPTTNNIDILNCLYLRNLDKVSCSPGIGVTTNTSGALKVKISPSPVFGSYNIVKLFGRKSDGYDVALIYSCEVIPGRGTDQNLFLLSRRPQLRFGKLELWFYIKTFERLGVRLQGGNSLGKVVFFPQNQCKYFFDGFTSMRG